MIHIKPLFLRKIAGNAFLALLAAGLTACAAPAPKPPTLMPRHLLHSPCAQARELPDDPDADPILFAGCDDAARTEFLRSNIGATVLLRESEYDEAAGQLKYTGGTGIVIDELGTVLTANHVISDADYIVATLQDLTENGQGIKRLRDVPMSVVAVSPENDAALLRPSHATAMPAPMVLCRHRLPAVDDVLWHFGRTTTWAAGKVSQLDVRVNSIDVIEVDVRVNFGDSGGPLVNAAGELVGITLSKSGENTMFVVLIDQALTALKYDGGTDACPE